MYVCIYIYAYTVCICMCVCVTKCLLRWVLMEQVSSIVPGSTVCNYLWWNLSYSPRPRSIQQKATREQHLGVPFYSKTTWAKINIKTTRHHPWKRDATAAVVVDVHKLCKGDAMAGGLRKPPRARTRTRTRSTSVPTARLAGAPGGYARINNSCSSSLSPRRKHEQQQRHENEPVGMSRSRTNCGAEPANRD